MSEINRFGSEERYGELILGWYLVRFRGDRICELSSGLIMKDGDWGLTHSNDPSFTISCDPLPKYSKSAKYLDVANDWGKGLVGSIEDCHSLMSACILAGYNPNKERLRFWLMHHCWDYLKKMGWKPIEISHS